MNPLLGTVECFLQSRVIGSFPFHIQRGIQFGIRHGENIVRVSYEFPRPSYASSEANVSYRRGNGVSRGHAHKAAWYLFSKTLREHTLYVRGPA